MGPANRPERHRRIGQSEGRRPDGWDLASELTRDQAQRVHVAGLALICRHAGGGVALHVLDRLEALAHRELDVFRRHIVLEVDKGLDRLLTGWSGHNPRWLEAGETNCRRRS